MRLVSAMGSLLLRRFTLRHWRNTPRQSVLLVLILALGVGVFFSIRLANRAAVASFRNFTEVVTQQSDWIVSAPGGALPESDLDKARGAVSGLAVHILPVLETTATRPRSSDEEAVGSRKTYQVLGLDLVTIQNLRASNTPDRSWFSQANSSSASSPGAGFWDVLRDPRGVFISEALARREGLGPGGSMTMVIQDRVEELHIRGVIPEVEGSPAPPDNLLVMDLPALQRLTGRQGWLDRIEFVLEEGPARDRRTLAVRDRLADAGGESWRVTAPADRKASAATMTRAFRFNLTILSLIALLVGLYLIFQALDGAVVRRREEIGILRSLGVEEGMIRRAWLREAALLGMVGGVLGLGLGWAGGQVSVRLVGRTVNALYYATSVEAAHLTAGEALLAVAVAVLASLLAGWLPAREAARIPPAQILVRHAISPPGGPVWRREWLGALCLILGLVFSQLPPVRLEGGGRLPWAGYVAALCWIVGGGIVGGGFLRWIARLARPFGKWLMPLKLATSHVVLPSSRHRWAVAGLVCAIAMTAGMAILVASFDRTMRGWIERTFLADLYISSDGAQSASTRNYISPETWQALLRHPAVGPANLVQAEPIELPEGRTLLVGANLAFMEEHTEIAWVQPPSSRDLLDSSRNVGLAMISESFAERFDKARGDIVEIPTPTGLRSLRLAGVFADYGNEQGSVIVDQVHFRDWFQTDQLRNLILFILPGQDIAQVRAEFLEQHPGLAIYTNEHLRREILRIFRQTFSITYALELIGVVVAVAGLGLTLASVLLERRAELTTLRALGLTHGQMARATACEGALVSLGGLGAGLAISVALGWLLIHVINKQSFGWTLQFTLPWLQLTLFSALILTAGVGVSYGVGRWGADLPADREE